MKKQLRLLVIVAAIAAAFVLGLTMGRQADQPGPGEAVTGAGGEHVEWWTCSMDPEVRSPKPGRCPKCGMALIPLKRQASDEGGTAELTLSPRAAKLAEVEVAPVERRPATAEVRMVGKVRYDETRLGYVTARVPGRLDRLFVDFTGAAVKQGDATASIYSPELLAAQEELIQAVKAAEDLAGSTVPGVQEMTRNTADAARAKLRLWGLSDEQVREIERSRTAADHVTLNAPISGVVVEKNVLEGAYVETGTRIFTIADLSTVWIVLDAYESDLAWIRYAQPVEFATDALPGEVFTGRIAFIEPVLDDATRTVKVRLNAPNARGRLKPEMFVHAVVRASIDADGSIVSPDLAGKWISPRHPEVIKDAPGLCDVCGAPLVRAETLGYAAAGAPGQPLVIPASAPIITGKRAVVYVRTAAGSYEGREVALGPRAGGYYVVAGGLAEGEQVAVRGNFKIDSALQIQAKPSAMNSRRPQETPGGEAGPVKVGQPPGPPAPAEGHRHE